MKVKELIAKLQALGPELDVLCYSEDEEISGVRSLFLDIQSVEEVRGVNVRDKHGKPGVRFGSGSDGEPVVLIEVTSNF